MPKEKTAIIILGASGDLARRKLIPALSVLREQGHITPDSIIVGSARSAFTNEEFRDRFDVCDEFKKQFFYHQGTTGLKAFVRQKGAFHRIIAFLALPPSSYEKTVEQLYNDGFREELNLVIEKPFGHDYQSARHLNDCLHQFYPEEQIFRSDHYLAKEAVQNILIFRFANSIFDTAWHSNSVESIQISAFETIGVEERGGYFDQAGSIRDMVQNHLFQMLCLVAMDPPVSLDPEDIRRQKINVLKAIEVEYVRRGQYNGYLDEKDVAPDSKTETWAEIKLWINNHRWAGTPVYIRTGKALPRKGTEIGLRLKKKPHELYNRPDGTAPNEIIFKVQPAEGIILQLTGKNPGMNLQLASTNMAFCYNDSFDEEIPEAYQKLLVDALRGDHTLFVSAEENEIAWRKLEGLSDLGELIPYEKGTVPESMSPNIWIDFEKYSKFC